MQFISFTTAMPLDHLSKGLDELRRIGFGLCSVSVNAQDPAGSIQTSCPQSLTDVRIDYSPRGAASPETLLQRIARMPGILDLRSGAALRETA